MKSVLISIKPKWCELIASGKKTVEVRKTKPKIETPFKVYLYCTKADERLVAILKDGDENYGEIYHGKPVFIKSEEGSVCDMYGKRQKVIGEFVCDEIYNCRDVNMDDTCITFAEWLKYTRGHEGEVYGWHISDLKIYDKPKELHEFQKPCADPYRCCKYCEHGIFKYPADVEVYEDLTGCCFETICSNRVTRPPQSWCYVEELEE